MAYVWVCVCVRETTLRGNFSVFRLRKDHRHNTKSALSRQRAATNENRETFTAPVDKRG